MPSEYVRSAVKLKDGTTMSIQASEFHYSTPRETDSPFYTHYEVGFVKKGDSMLTMPQWWAQYGEDRNENSDVYAYVPVNLIYEFIMDHGGICGIADEIEVLKS